MNEFWSMTTMACTTGRLTTTGLAVAGCVTVAVWSTAAAAGDANGPTTRCLQTVTGPDGGTLSVTDCMRIGRHIRVESSISRGTASLGAGDGFTSTSLQRDEAGSALPRRLHVRDVPGGRGLLSQGFFGR